MTNQFIEYAVVQVGHAVFGLGATKDEACADAVQWLDRDEDGNPVTAERVADACAASNPRETGAMAIVCRSDDPAAFDELMEGQHDLLRVEGGWIREA